MRSIRETTLFAAAALTLVFAAPGSAQKPEPTPKTRADSPKSAPAKSDLAGSEKEGKQTGVSILHIEITAGEKDQPVESASVYVRFPEARLFGREKLVEMNVKTNHEGTVKLPKVPRGKALIQVIATGWKTFGKWFELDQAEQTIKIKLEKPPRWY